jgi:hypothetical protein
MCLFLCDGRGQIKQIICYLGNGISIFSNPQKIHQDGRRLLVLVGFITHYVHTLPQGLQELLLFAQQINQHGIDITDWHNVWKERIFSPCRLSYHIRLGY